MLEPIVLSEGVKKNLWGVVALMEKNIERIDMTQWVYTTKPGNGVPEAACGTTGCIAGYICMYHGYDEKFLENLPRIDFTKDLLPTGATKVPGRYYLSPKYLAAVLMGMKLEQADDLEKLFYEEEWPEPYLSQYEYLLEENGNLPIKNRKQAGRIVIDRFKHFIETGL